MGNAHEIVKDLQSHGQTHLNRKEFVYMRKVLAGIIIALCTFSVAYAQDMKSFICDGGISISGKIESLKAGEYVTITVVKDSADWLNYDYWLNGDADGIVYYTENTATENGKFKFEFSLPQNGIYRAYIGTSSLKEPKEILFRYINEQNNEDAISELLANRSDEDAIQSILISRRMDLGIFDSIFDEVDHKSVAGILRFSLQNTNGLSTEEAITLIEKAMVASLLNEGKIDDLNSYSKYFQFSDAFEFYNKEFSKLLTIKMSKINITSVEDFDEKLIDNIILCCVNQNDGVGTIRSVLNKYSGRIGIDSSKITTSLCSSISQSNGFNTISELRDFINNYKELVSTGGGGNGVRSGTDPGKNYYIGQTITHDIVTEANKVETIKVFDDIDIVPWAEEAITQLYYKGIIHGKEENKFYPLDTVKREEFAKIITVALSIDLIDDDFTFTDVNVDHWSYPYVKSAYLAGITNGISDTLFGMGLDITRQDLCVMVYKALAACDILLPEKNSEVVFHDESSIATYAREAVSSLQKAGIISGDENGNFNPNGFASRAEAAKIIYYVISAIK